METSSKLKMTGITFPKEKCKGRSNPTVVNDTAILNAVNIFYGGAKAGKTTTLVNTFTKNKVEFIFLDFDRNYQFTVDKIQKSGAVYLNGSAAYDVLDQLMSGKPNGAVVILDALGSIRNYMVDKFIADNVGTDEAEHLQGIKHNIGVTHDATVAFFNYIVEPMSHGNSINFIHHTTQTMHGEKMEGNKGAWSSVFDNIYRMDRESRSFILENSRCYDIAPKTIGVVDPIITKINSIRVNKAKYNDELGKNLVERKFLTNHPEIRDFIKVLDASNNLEYVEVPRDKKKYLDADIDITRVGNKSRLNIKKKVDEEVNNTKSKDNR